MTQVYKRFQILASTLLVLLAFTTNGTYAAKLGEECNITASEPECEREHFQVCTAAREAVAHTCNCLPGYEPDLSANLCKAGLGKECVGEVSGSCNHSLAECLGNSSDNFICRCKDHYTQTKRGTCMAPLNATCIEYDGCIDERAMCTDISEETTPPPSTSTLAPSNLPSSTAPSKRELPRPRGHSPRELPEMQELICLCETGYKENKEGKCVKSGAATRIYSWMLIFIIITMENFW